MHKNIPLKGLYCNSLENCIISTEKTGIRIRSTIVGSHENNHYTIEYLDILSVKTVRECKKMTNKPEIDPV